MYKVAETSISIREIEKVFTENPKLGHEQLRQLKADQRAEFLRQSIEVLDQGTTNSFSQVLLQLCREDSSNLKQMLFTADLLSLEDAAKLLRISSKNDPGYQVHLMASVKAEFDQAGTGIASQEFTRLLDILAKAVDPERLGGMLASLCDHPDDRLRSKVALLSRALGRSLPKRSELLKDPDPRVRANTVESFWGQRDPESIQFFKDASLDSHHRVAANALYGLYQAGEISSVRGILKMVREQELPRQLAAIWVIGQTADPRFHSVVHENLAIKTGRLKFALLNAGRKIKKRLDELRQMPPLQISLVNFERVDKGRVRCSFLLCHDDGQVFEPDEMMATQVLLHDGDLRVDQFHFEARGGSEPLQAAFLIPLRTGVSNAFAMQMVSAIEKAVGVKRPDDSWTIAKYKPVPDGAAAEPADCEFTKDSGQLLADQLRSVKGAADNLLAGVEACVSAFPGNGQKNHIVTVFDPEVAAAWAVPEHWPDLFEKHGVIFHVICCRELEAEAIQAWRKFCISRRGIFSYAAQTSQLASIVERIARGIPAHFYVSYQLGRSLPNTDELERVSIEVIPASGYARLVIQGNGEPIAEPFTAGA